MELTKFWTTQPNFCLVVWTPRCWKRLQNFYEFTLYSERTLIWIFRLVLKNENPQAFFRFTKFVMTRRMFVLPPWTMQISKKPANSCFVELAGSRKFRINVLPRTSQKLIPKIKFLFLKYFNNYNFLNKIIDPKL